MDDAEVAIRLFFPKSVTQFFRNYQATFKVVYGSFKVSQTEIDDAKVPIRISFPQSVTQFFRDFQVTFVIVYVSFKVF